MTATSTSFDASTRPDHMPDIFVEEFDPAAMFDDRGTARDDTFSNGMARLDSVSQA